MTETTEVTENVASDDASLSQVVETPEVEEAPREYTQVEQEEMARGWKPDGKKSAEEFRAYREEYNNSLQRVQSELRDTKKSIDFLLNQNARLAEEGYQRALESLRREQEEAAYVGDVATVNRKTEEIVNLANQIQQSKVPQIKQNQTDMSPEDERIYLDWINKNNSWYVRPGQNGPAKNVAITEYANRREAEIRMSNPMMPSNEVLRVLDADLRTTFPGLLKENPGSFVAGKSSTSGKQSYDASDLSDFHKEMIAYNKANVKGFDEKAYIKQVMSLRTK